MADNSQKAAHLEMYKFKPGESGNPGGRPKKLAITDYVKEQLDKQIPEAMRAKLPALFVAIYGENATFGEMLAFKLVQMSAKGDMPAMKELLERVEGKVPQKTQLSGVDGAPIETAITIKFVDPNAA
jgi:hypothetical protein